MSNPLLDAVEALTRGRTAADVPLGPEVTYRVPLEASIRLADRVRPGDHPLAGATITAWA